MHLQLVSVDLKNKHNLTKFNMHDTHIFLYLTSFRAPNTVFGKKMVSSSKE